MNNKDVVDLREKTNDNFQKLKDINRTKRLNWFKKRRYSNI